MKKVEIMVKISVIIPTCNNEADIAKCLKTLKNQKFRDFEIIIVDAHSTDKTVDIARKYGAKIEYETVGTAWAACNVGAKIAEGEILIFTDADAYFPENWLRDIEGKFRNDVELVAWGGEDIIEREENYFETAVFQLDLARIGAKIDPKKRIRGCNCAFRKDIFLTEGGFNDRLSAMGEQELLYRLARKKHKMKFNSKIYVYHHRRKNFGGLFKQFFRNGIGTINALKMSKEVYSIYHILPLLGILVFLFWVLVLAMDIAYVLIFIVAYMLSLLLRSLHIILETKKWCYLPILPIIIAIREIGFSLGLFYGMFNYKKPAKKM